MIEQFNWLKNYWDFLLQQLVFEIAAQREVSVTSAQILSVPFPTDACHAIFLLLGPEKQDCEMVREQFVGIWWGSLVLGVLITEHDILQRAVNSCKQLSDVAQHLSAAWSSAL